MWFPKSRIIDFNRVDEVCNHLYQRVVGMQMHSVISIETGGWYAGEKLSQLLNIPHYTITVRRYQEEDLLWFCGLFPRPLRIIPIVLQSGVHMFRQPQVLSDLSTLPPLSGQRVLLVDDCVHTGATMEVAQKAIRKLGPDYIQPLALVNVGEPKHNSCMFEIQGLHEFPWSQTSKQYSQFLELRKSL
jgi:hypoxanthine phosphoribosyltransferase